MSEALPVVAAFTAPFICIIGIGSVSVWRRVRGEKKR